jgi:hypothetical protein
MPEVTPDRLVLAKNVNLHERTREQPPDQTLENFRQVQAERKIGKASSFRTEPISMDSRGGEEFGAEAARTNPSGAQLAPGPLPGRFRFATCARRRATCHFARTNPSVRPLLALPRHDRELHDRSQSHQRSGVCAKRTRARQRLERFARTNPSATVPGQPTQERFRTNEPKTAFGESDFAQTNPSGARRLATACVLHERTRERTARSAPAALASRQNTGCLPGVSRPAPRRSSRAARPR